MEPRRGERRVSFLGEVVETCQREGKTLATVALKSICLEIDADTSQEVHLGDHVIVEARMQVQSVQQHFEGDQPCTPSQDLPETGSHTGR
jgi:hydrogenase maturation factor